MCPAVLRWPTGGTIAESSIALIGAGGHARSCIDVLEQLGLHRVAGLVGRADEVGSCVLGYPVMATDDDLPALVSQIPLALVAVGQLRSAAIRVALRQRALDAGFTLPVIVSPYAYVSRHSQVGSGTIVMHQAFINAGVQVGENCIINTRAHLEHDVRVGADCHVSTGAVLNGGVHVARGCFVGSHSVIMEGVEIPAGSVVPMGSVVTRRNVASVLSAGSGRQT